MHQVQFSETSSLKYCKLATVALYVCTGDSVQVLGTSLLKFCKLVSVALDICGGVQCYSIAYDLLFHVQVKHVT